MGENKTQSQALGIRALTIIRVTAHRLIETELFNSSERGDLEQELTLHLLKRYPRYDSTKATFRTFVARILEHKAANLRRERRRRLRVEPREPLSPSSAAQNPLDAIDADAYEMALGRRHRSREAEIDLNLDLAQTIATLPPGLKAACRLLQLHSKTQVARQLGLSLDALEARVIRPLREAFTRAGLHDSL